MRAALIIQHPVQEVSSNNNYMVIRSSNKTFRIKIAHIFFIESLGDYVIIKTGTDKYVTKITMNDMCVRLPSELFIRTHRSFIINIKKIRRINSTRIIINHNNLQCLIPIGRFFKKALEAKLYQLKN
jgi:DNA-binding LytR/AlgR family response regulator